MKVWQAWTSWLSTTPLWAPMQDMGLFPTTSLSPIPLPKTASSSSLSSPLVTLPTTATSTSLSSSSSSSSTSSPSSRPSAAAAAATITSPSAADPDSAPARRAVIRNKRPKKAASKPMRLPDLSQKAFPERPDQPYDLIVLGSGPGGESAAVQAARYGAKVAVVEIKGAFGGPTGLTSKAVREAAKLISKAVDQVGGDTRRQIRRLWSLRFPVVRTEAEVMQAAETRGRLKKSLIDLYIGSAVFVPNDMATVDVPEGGVVVRVCRATECVELAAKQVCIATGSRPCRPEEISPGVRIPFTPGKVVDASEIANMRDLPNAVCIIGGGVIAVEYATVFAKLQVGVTLLCPKDGFMPFLPEELRSKLYSRLERDRVLVLNEPIRRIDVGSDGRVRVLLEAKPGEKPKRVMVDKLLYSGGRDANSEGLGCEDVDIKVGKYGRIVVNDRYLTTNPAVYAVGDVIGPPQLASAAQQQARKVADTLFLSRMKTLRQLIKEKGQDIEDFVDDDFFDATGVGEWAVAARPNEGTEDDPKTNVSTEKELWGSMDAPLTLWTVPEIASVGESEESANKMLAKGEGDKRQVVVGYAYFRDTARGRLTDPEGFLKVVARCCDMTSNHQITGVQIIGEGANELIQLGSILVHSQATLEQVSSTPFAAVTLAGLYLMAADDALCRSPFNVLMSPLKRKMFG